MPNHPLEPLLRPRSVTVLGASPRASSLGQTVVRNLIDAAYTGAVYPIQPSASEVDGILCYAALRALPTVPECAVVCLGADKVVDALEEAAALGVRAAVVLASGFAETDADGQARQHALESLCARTGMVICGPNCLGLVNVAAGIPLYSASLGADLRRGNLAVISHSGSCCIALSGVERLALSHLVSAGNGAVVDMADYLDYLAGDAATRAAALFIETIRDPRGFARAAAKMHAAGKPIVALKVGRSVKGATATASHTGSLAGSNAVYQDYFRRIGVIAVDDYDELVESCVLMQSTQPLPRGRGVAVLNVSGGEIALTCDLAEDTRVELPVLSPTTVARLRGALPAFATPRNPLDATGTAVFDMTMYRACIEALAADPAIAIVAVCQDCPAGTGPAQAETYRTIAATAAVTASAIEKPLIFYSNLASGLHPRVVEPLHEAGVPALQGARAALLAIRRLIDYAAFNPKDAAAYTDHLEGLIDMGLVPIAAWQERFKLGTALTEREAKQFLAAHGLPVTRERLARNADEAVAAAREIGFPVALKIESADVPHKTEAGGVRLNVQCEADVHNAFASIVASVSRFAPHATIAGVLVQEMITGGVEALVGVSCQIPFGSAIVVGSGGVLVEWVRDSALALVPVNEPHARALVAATRLSTLLAGFRGAQPADLDALVRLVVQVSDIAKIYGNVIDSLDLNPVSVLPRGQGVRVLDAMLMPRIAAHHQ
ncbi:MAG: acetate--CoA ligase family protein [Burkholderiales bacterium]